MDLSERKQIANLLASAFANDPSELRRLVNHVLGAEIAGSMGGTAAQELAFETVEICERRGLGLGRLLAAARENRPLHAYPIQSLARRLGFDLPRIVGDPQVPLGETWFRARLSEALAQLDQRYVLTQLGRDAHVFVEAERVLDAVARGPDLQLSWAQELNSVARSARRCFNLGATLGQERASSLRDACIQLATRFGQTSFAGSGNLDLDPIRSDLTSLLEAVDEAFEHAVDREVPVAQGPLTESRGIPGSERDQVAAGRAQLRELQGSLASLEHFIGSVRVAAAVRQVLLVVGPAGSGKSHLLAHFATKQLDAGRPALLILGEWMGGNGPALQDALRVISAAGPPITLDELDALAASRACQGVLLIDALNETPEARYWSRFLPALVEQVGLRRHLSLVVSVREEYVRDIVPDGLRRSVPTVLHSGFRNTPRHLLGPVFHAYGLESPRQAILAPELLNPLMLHLVCRNLEELGLPGLEAIPEGLAGLFGWIVEQVDRRLGRQEFLDYDDAAGVVREAMVAMGRALVESDIRTIPASQLRRLIQPLLEEHSFAPTPKDLVRAMAREGLLNLFVPPTIPGRPRAPRECRLQFQRMEDWVVAEALVTDMSCTSEDPRVKGILDRVSGEYGLDWRYRGVLVQVSVILAERWQVELSDAALGHACEDDALDAWRRGLPLRTTKSITQETVSTFRAWMTSPGRKPSAIFGALCEMALRRGHKLNANYLDALLWQLPMPVRDQTWSEFVYYSSDSHDHPLWVLLQWARRLPANASVDESTAWLAGLVLSWTFTTSHRPTRDHATKALSSIIARHPALGPRLLRRFATIDDPYVLERVAAAAYGAATRHGRLEDLEELAGVVLNLFFCDVRPPEHVLTRDYLCGIVACAANRGAVLPDRGAAATPPYGPAAWPADLPEESTLIQKLATPDKRCGPSSTLLNSMGPGGDFWRYVVGANAGFSVPWTCRPRGAELSVRERRVQVFLAQATPEQALQWEEIRQLELSSGDWDEEFFEQLEPMDQQEILALMRHASDSADSVHYAVSIMSRVRAIEESRLEAKVAALTGDLDEAGRRRFLDARDAVARLAHDDSGQHFPANLARRWMLNRVLELGWDEPTMGPLDQRRGRDSFRSAHKPERLGKKYQWLAWHGLLASMQDAFEPLESYWSGRAPSPFFPEYRDIDPTCLVSRTGGRTHPNGRERCWWAPDAYEERITDLPHDEWAWHDPSLPKLPRLLDHRDASGDRWLLLAGYREWTEPTPIGHERYEYPARSYHTLIRSMVVRTAHADAMLRWMGEQDMFGRWLPENRSSPDVHLREAWWHPAVRSEDSEADSEWRRVRHPSEDWHGVPTHVDYVAGDSSHDCSVDETFDISLPAPWLVDRLGLKHGRGEGEWITADGRLAVVDPSVVGEGPSALLVRPTVLRLLEAEGFTVLWFALGELSGVRNGTAAYVAATSAAALLRGEEWDWHQTQHGWGGERREDRSGPGTPQAT